MSERPKKGKFIWSKEATMSLIECYQNNPILYNIADPAYKNKLKKEAALNNIREELEKNEFCQRQCITIDDIRSKIHILRTQFNKEQKKMSASKSTGSGGKEADSTFWLYENLMFLKGSNICNESDSNLDDTFHDLGNNNNDVEMVEQNSSSIIYEGTLDELEAIDDVQASTSGLPKIKNSKVSMQKEVVKLLTSATAALQTKGNDNDIDSFCRYLGIEMKKLKNLTRVRNLKLKFMQWILKEQEEEEG